MRRALAAAKTSEVLFVVLAVTELAARRQGLTLVLADQAHAAFHMQAFVREHFIHPFDRADEPGLKAIRCLGSRAWQASRKPDSR